MTQRILSRAQVRAVDQLAADRFGIPGLILMENAGRGCAEAILAADPRGPVLIACGGGNNGGDGFVIARHLAAHGIAPRVLLAGAVSRLPPDALVNWEIICRLGLECELLAEHASAEPSSQISRLAKGCVWIVDALLGTGARGAPRPPHDALIRALNALPGCKLAVDLPSGLDADTGEVCDPTFAADITCTFVAPKPGLLVPSAAATIGELRVIPVGIPALVVDAACAPAAP